MDPAVNETVLNHVDYGVLSSGYSGFLFALGGVGVTVLTLVLTLGKARLDGVFAALVGSLTVFALACFVGAHLHMEASAIRGTEGGISQDQFIRRQYVLAEPNIFISASLFLFTITALPFAYENNATRVLRPLLAQIGIFTGCSIGAWYVQTILLVGIRPIPVLFVGVVIGLGSFGVSFKQARVKGVSLDALRLTAIAVISTEAYTAGTLVPLRAVSLLDAIFMSVTVALGVGSIAGMGAGIASYGSHVDDRPATKAQSEIEA